MKAIDENKICFIACVNNQQLYEESLSYISRLIIPAGMKIDCLSVEGAEGMCAGYQQAMQSSNAKFKIYLHQDVFIQDENFLINIIAHFRSNPECGLLGVVGSESLWMESVWWYMPKAGAIIDEGPDGKLREERLEGAEHPRSVAAADGLLLATQYDVDWREDLFDKWHFYDISQCMEFRRRGYDVQLIGQQQTACIHMCGKGISQHGYQESRISFLREYKWELWEGIFKDKKRIGPFTTIAVVKHDNEAVYRLCLECIENNTAADTYEIITVNSSDGIEGINAAFSRAAGSEIMLLDDRVVVTPHWRDNLLMALYGNPKTGAVGPAANDCHVGQDEVIEFSNISELMTKAQARNAVHPGRWHCWPILEGFCFFVRRDVYEESGGFDAGFRCIDHAVGDFCFRLQQQGYRLVAAHDTFVFRNGIVVEADKKDLEMLSKRWQISNNYKVLDSFLLKSIGQVESGQRVLVVGRNAFVTMYYLKFTVPHVELSYYTDSFADFVTCRNIVHAVYARNVNEPIIGGIKGHFDYSIVLKGINLEDSTLKMLMDHCSKDNILINNAGLDGSSY